MYSFNFFNQNLKNKVCFLFLVAVLQHCNMYRRAIPVFGPVVLDTKMSKIQNLKISGVQMKACSRNFCNLINEIFPQRKKLFGKIKISWIS